MISRIQTLIQCFSHIFLLFSIERLGKRNPIMRKIAKLTAAAAFFAVFANSENPTDIDSIFANMEFQLPPLDSSYRIDYSTVSPVKNSDKEQDGAYTLQFDAIADFDAAQARRAKLKTQIGYEIQMIFDAPFYKLRGGYFRNKLEADDKARELSLYNISAFAAKIK